MLLGSQLTEEELLATWMTASGSAGADSWAKPYFVRPPTGVRGEAMCCV